MSYILDALNKSEKERARKRAPGLAALHGDQDRTAFTLKHFLIILAILILVNFVGLYLLFGERLGLDAEPSPIAAPGQTQTHTQIKTQTLKHEADQTQITAEEEAEEEPELITPPTASSIASRAQPVVTDYEAVGIDELPLAIQARLPVIEVTTHIYASDAELRMVKIDGEPRYEGDILATDFQLLEITESGVILAFEGYAYVLDVIEDWLE